MNEMYEEIITFITTNPDTEDLPNQYTDNPYLTVDYEKWLKYLQESDPKLYRKMKYGDWKINFYKSEYHVDIPDGKKYYIETMEHVLKLSLYYKKHVSSLSFEKKSPWKIIVRMEAEHDTILQIKKDLMGIERHIHNMAKRG